MTVSYVRKYSNAESESSNLHFDSMRALLSSAQDSYSRRVDSRLGLGHSSLDLIVYLVKHKCWFFLIDVSKDAKITSSLSDVSSVACFNRG
jgi:hypothetical protein